MFLDTINTDYPLIENKIKLIDTNGEITLTEEEQEEGKSEAEKYIDESREYVKNLKDKSPKKIKIRKILNRISLGLKVALVVTTLAFPILGIISILVTLYFKAMDVQEVNNKKYIRRLEGKKKSINKIADKANNERVTVKAQKLIDTIDEKIERIED